MKQVLQNLRTGETQLVEVPIPSVSKGHLLIETKVSLISLGTEKMLVQFSQSGWINKARSQPERVQQVISKIKTDGLFPTIRSVASKLDTPLPLGYCNAGKVVKVGEGVTDFHVGDRVISNGPHAEMVSVPQNLCARIPEDVSFEEASFTVLGSIALQGLRLAEPTIGESFVVTGLGLVGMLTVQLLKANGCRVLGVDIDPIKLDMAQNLGVETINATLEDDLRNAVEIFTKNRGADGVIITASADSNRPLRQAAEQCRKRGRIILIGVVPIEIPRKEFYEKELTFQVSCSYGPGRYDEEYELKGQDYPLGYVRWTEQRNFEAILEMMDNNRINVEGFISHRFSINKGIAAYETVLKEKSILGLILTYDELDEDRRKSEQTIPIGGKPNPSPGNVFVGLIGAGAYTGTTLLPNLVKTSAYLKTIISSGGVSSTKLGRKFGFTSSSTELDVVMEDPEINAVIITTRHDTHASIIIQALKKKKHVFVEKPLALSIRQLEDIESTLNSLSNPFLMVGFNRRFSPHIQKIKSLLETVSGPKSLIMTVNAGFIPENHWVHDPERGGGRIIGEACHFIDILRYIVKASIEEIQAIKIGDSDGMITQDKMSISIKFSDGSFGNIHYLANGHKSFPKERLEVFCSGRVLQLDNYRKLTGFGWPKFRKMNLWSQDKGHQTCIHEFIRAVQEGRRSPVPINDSIEVTRASFEALALAK